MANISEFDIKVIKTELRKRSQGDNFFGDVCHSAIGYIKSLESAITEKQKHLENLQKVNEELEERLKEQQPKLMTLEEVEQSNGKDVFVEVHFTPNGNLNFPKYDAIYASTIDKEQLTFDYVWFCLHIKYKKDYGVSWRCWTARPTEEQRKAEPWKDGEQE